METEPLGAPAMLQDSQGLRGRQMCGKTPAALVSPLIPPKMCLALLERAKAIVASQAAGRPPEGSATRLSHYLRTQERRTNGAGLE